MTRSGDRGRRKPVRDLLGGGWRDRHVDAHGARAEPGASRRSKAKASSTDTPGPTDPVTPGFRRLLTGPQTALDLAGLAPDEREQVRQLEVAEPVRPVDRRPVRPFVPVTYLPADEEAAIALFAALNAPRIAALDVGRENVLRRQLSPGRYVRVLAAAGRVDVRRYSTVVREAHEDGTWWLIEPGWYDAAPASRYDPGPRSARVSPDVDLQGLYQALGDVITLADIDATPIDGGPGMVLRYFWAVDGCRCRPVQSPDGELVLEKHDRRTASEHEPRKSKL